MDEVCVHCGHPVINDGLGVLVHRDGKRGAPQMCPTGIGRVACLPQGGVE
ncbi:hypothetical protein SEA_DAEGAL_68 [Mycobacterium phage Daegal]|uniref:Uncharacterized protein n=1 Tax=Mycobacterium phage Daegal TaxID=2517946 RepID=A0A482MDI9_9CAUD|nr:hypothetical protein SEA_DAEGAL_68 [Mycobacterium phage Daegal]